MRFLIFGDVVGRPGREAVTRALPDLQREHAPDAVIINIENIAHGAGISPSTFAEAQGWRADVYTTGDHAWDNEQGIGLLQDTNVPIIRPANYPPGVPGRGYHIFGVGAWQVAVINLQGQVFFKRHPDNPFHCLDTLLQQPDIAAAHFKLLDFHVEATSEARAMGWHADGRLTAVWGTHIHVPTADAQILPQGCAYVTCVGMNGAHHSIIGGSRGLLRGFLTQQRVRFDIDEADVLEVGALVVEADPRTGLATAVAPVRKILHATS